MSPKWISIKTKVALVICLISSISFSVFFTTNYNNTIQRIHRHSEQLIARNHQVHARHIMSTLEGMRQDLEAIAGFPPIAGILRTQQTTFRVDPSDGSPLGEWRKRLETLFSSMIANREGYSQIRFILPDGNWTEFVRVDSRDGVVSLTPWSQMQEKGDEPYIADVLHHPISAPIFSNVTRNREHGTIEGPPTVRAMKAILGKQGEVVGIIVVNATVAELLTLPQTSGQIGTTYYTIENFPSPYARLAPEDESFVLQSENAPSLSFDTLGHAEEKKLVALDGTDGLFVSTLQFKNIAPPFAIRVATRVDMHALYYAARAELGRNIANAAFLSLFASLLGYFFTARLLRPFQNMVDEIQARSGILSPLKTKFTGSDEIAVIGRSFTQLTNSLIRETQRLDMILSNVAEGIMTLKMNGDIEDLNPAARTILGLSSDDDGTNFLEILNRPDLLTAERLTTLQSPDPSSRQLSMELSIHRQDGTLVHLQINLCHAFYEEGDRIIVMLRDITAQTKATAQSEALIAALKKSNAELDQFAYVASHDLKAPLRVISNAVSWLEEDLAPHLTDDTRESMNLLQSRTSRMERLLNDLLQHSRIGRVAEPDIQISGREMAEDLLSLLEIPPGMAVQFSESFLSATLRKLPLETVLVNLISNGIKHHDRPQGRIHVDLVATKHTFYFSVSDDGPGIEEKYHDRIFEVFQTLKSRDQLEASGMGLAFVKKHISVAGGEIKVISDGTRGTTFEFSWPRDLVQQHTQAA